MENDQPQYDQSLCEQTPCNKTKNDQLPHSQTQSNKTKNDQPQYGQTQYNETTNDKAQYDQTQYNKAQNEYNPIVGMFSGDSILQSLPGFNSASETGAVAEGAKLLPDNLAYEIAERILVSGTNETDRTAEVRINLKDSILPDTEVILRRDGDSLKITLLTNNASSHQTLLESSPALKALLVRQRGSDENISVEVTLRGNAQQGGNYQGGQQNQRSRGLDYLNGELK
ncbi:MAG: type III secretion HpaP family protein [Deltaproteobacteria bacterium]|nr:type III secretion HpaP family protein [Deltaproteobacteria bacterium]